MEGSMENSVSGSKQFPSSEFQILDLDKYIRVSVTILNTLLQCRRLHQVCPVNVLVELNFGNESPNTRRIAVPSRLIIVLSAGSMQIDISDVTWLDSAFVQCSCIAKRTDAFGRRSCLMMRVIRVVVSGQFTKWSCLQLFQRIF